MRRLVTDVLDLLCVLLLAAALAVWAWTTVGPALGLVGAGVGAGVGSWLIDVLGRPGGRP